MVRSLFALDAIFERKVDKERNRARSEHQQRRVARTFLPLPLSLLLSSPLSPSPRPLIDHPVHIFFAAEQPSPFLSPLRNPDPGNKNVRPSSIAGGEKGQTRPQPEFPSLRFLSRSSPLQPTTTSTSQLSFPPLRLPPFSPLRPLLFRRPSPLARLGSNARSSLYETTRSFFRRRLGCKKDQTLQRDGSERA